jgi:hypothetical protein
VERVVSLLSRITQADALTLTNRLKRQHLKGADVGHLSRSTVGGIVSEATALRSQFRVLLEDNKVPILCTRKDLRGLFQFLKDIFTLTGEMRITLNDVILDPSTARKVSELAMDSTNGEASRGRQDAGTSGWMAPITKLFAGANATGEASTPSAPSPLVRTTSQRGIPRVPSRMIHKLEPALSAQATTVNVEFSGTGVGRSVTNTFSAHPVREEDNTLRNISPTSPAPSNVSRNVMGIFAGAPRGADTSDAWVKIDPPRGHQRVQSVQRLNSATLGRGTLRHGGNLNNRLSRNVDAVIDFDTPRDGDEEDTLGPLLQHTLRRRGLSDSSIHSTFMNQSEEAEITPYVTMHDQVSAQETWGDKTSVLKALGRKVQNFRFAASSLSSSPSGNPPVASPLSESSSPPNPRDLSSSPPSNNRTAPVPVPTTSNIASMLIPTGLSLASWAGGPNAFETEPYHVSSVRGDALIHRSIRRPDQNRDFF